MRTSIAEKHTNHLVAGLGPLKSSSQYFVLINLRVFSPLNGFASFLACCLLSLLAGNRKSRLSRVCDPLQLQNPVFDTSRLLPRFQSVSCPGHFPRTCLPRFLEKFVMFDAGVTLIGCIGCCHSGLPGKLVHMMRGEPHRPPNDNQSTANCNL